jgi:cytochrome-b5 reductase
LEKFFTGGEQGWVDLKLGAIEELSSNTKRFRFEFPDKDMISGLNVACEFVQVTEKRVLNSY